MRAHKAHVRPGGLWEHGGLRTPRFGNWESCGVSRRPSCPIWPIGPTAEFECFSQESHRKRKGWARQRAEGPNGRVLLSNQPISESAGRSDRAPVSSWRRQSSLGGGGDIRGGRGGGLRRRFGRGRDGGLVRRGGGGLRDGGTLPTGAGATDAFGRRRFFAGLDVRGHLLQLGGTGTEARGALGGGQRLRHGLAIFHGTGPSTPVTGLGVVTRRHGSGHARAIGAIDRHGAAVPPGALGRHGVAPAHRTGLGHASAIWAVGGTDCRCGGLCLLGKGRHGGKQEGRKEEGCSHGGIPFCNPKITHRHPKNKRLREQKTENRKQNAGGAAGPPQRTERAGPKGQTFHGHSEQRTEAPLRGDR